MEPGFCGNRINNTDLASCQVLKIELQYNESTAIIAKISRSLKRALLSPPTL